MAPLRTVSRNLDQVAIGIAKVDRPNGAQSADPGIGPVLFAAATKAHPNILSEIARGQFSTLRGWLTENVYRHGRSLTPDEIVIRATGSPTTMAPYLAYLHTKYDELYQLPKR